MAETRQQYEMYDELHDIITGFTGIVLGITKYSDGRIQYGLQTKLLQDGRSVDWVWLDSTRMTKSINAKIGFIENNNNAHSD